MSQEESMKCKGVLFLLHSQEESMKCKDVLFLLKSLYLLVIYITFLYLFLSCNFVYMITVDALSYIMWSMQIFKFDIQLALFQWITYWCMCFCCFKYNNEQINCTIHSLYLHYIS